MAVPCEMLLHPELMTNEQLICVIRERYLHVYNLESMRRDELLDLFHSFCFPLTQRKYRDSGRGRLLNMTRQPIAELTQFRKSLHNEISERIKPPTSSMKKLKLDITTQTVSETNNLKRKMIIDTAPPLTDSPPPKKERILIWPQFI